MQQPQHQVLDLQLPVLIPGREALPCRGDAARELATERGSAGEDVRPAAQRPVVDQGDGGEIDFLGLEATGGVEADVDVEAAGCFG